MDKIKLESQSGFASRLSNATGDVLARRIGPSATKIRTVVDRHAIVIIFSQGLTKGELTLINQGNADYVLTIRRELQRVIRDDLVGVVEELSGRNVTAFLADYHLDPDVGITAFLLRRDPHQPPDRNPDGTYPLDARTHRRLREIPPTVA